jgi:hypothetical protein
VLVRSFGRYSVSGTLGLLALAAAGCGRSSVGGLSAQCHAGDELELVPLCIGNAKTPPAPNECNSYEDGTRARWGGSWGDPSLGGVKIFDVRDIDLEHGGENVFAPCTLDDSCEGKPTCTKDDCALGNECSDGVCGTNTHGRCGLATAQKAVVIEYRGWNWWGGGLSLSLENATAVGARNPDGSFVLVNGKADDTAYEGIAFWAMAVGDSGWDFTLTDGQSSGTIPGPDGRKCSQEPDAPNGDRCGNNWSFAINFSHSWNLHWVPWDEMRQTVNGMVFLNGIDITHLQDLALLSPTAYDGQLWIDEIMLYRHKRK